MSLLRLLRERTREAHARAEERLDVPRRSRDREGYAALLADLRSVYAPLERALDDAPATRDVVPDWASRHKTRWLDDDLVQLGVAPVPDADVGALTTPEQVAGAAYVMEGATLGGALVLPMLLPDLPHRFFAGYGASRGARWREFRGHVDDLDLEPQEVVASALRTFAVFEGACGVRR